MRTVLVFVAAGAFLPLAAHATEIATFDWVSGTGTPENPVAAATTAAHGTLTLELSSFSLTGPSVPPNEGPYYSSGTTSASVIGLSYTFADGLTVNQSDLASTTVTTTSSAWLTSGEEESTPDNAPAGTPPGYFLVSAFTMSGTADGASFKIANSQGVAGATYINGLGNGDNSFNGAAGFLAITDGGYWELASVTPVPLPPGLVLLMSGLGLMAWLGKRNGLLRTL